MAEKIKLTVIETDRAQSWADRCHSARQALAAHLTVLRLRAGVQEGDRHQTSRDLSQVGGEGVAYIDSANSYSGNIRVQGGTTEGAAHTLYGFDTQTEALHSQELDAGMQPIGDPVEYVNDENGADALGLLHATLVRANSAPEVPAA